MKHKVSELEGALLDAAVAKALGLPYRMNGDCFANPDSDPDEPQDLMSTFEPSSYWDHGGPIIERERISVWVDGEGPRDGLWHAMVGAVHGWDSGEIVPSEAPYDREGIAGPTPLIAAMRAFCAAKFGEEVELP